MRNKPSMSMPRSTFDLSRGHKTTIDSGWLVPLFAEEVLPGDTFNVRSSIFARLTTPLTPFLDDVWMDIHYFFVPNRLVWANWQRFMGEQLNPDDTTDFLVPTVEIDLETINPALGPSVMLYNYLGVPLDGIAGVTDKRYTVTNLFGRAYNLIYNEFYRDQNLSNRAVVDTDDGPDAILDYKILSRSKSKDYFTSCLPWPQKGPGVEIPISGIPVEPASVGATPTFYVSGGTPQRFETAVSTPNAPVLSDTGAVGIFSWGVPNLVVGTGATDEAAGTINALRQAYQLQRLLERDARGGTRYIELLKSHFGVTSPDFRLQRPEYLGGGTIRLNINPVPQTSGTPGDLATGYTKNPQGNLAATATLAGTDKGFSKGFTEHGMVIAIASIKAQQTYQYALPKAWTRRTKYDFYWPSLQNIGEQAVLNKEIYLQPDGTAGNEEVFGYQERWAEYRMAQGRVSSIMHSGHPVSLDVWHLAEELSAVPTLSETWIQAPPPIDRVIAVPSQPQFVVDTYFMVKAARPLPVYSIPGMSDHF